MRKFFNFHIFLLAIIIFIQAFNMTNVQANVINYKGFLTETNGNPINKTIKMKFSIHNAKNESLWIRERFVTVNDGKFDVILGKVEPLEEFFFDGEHYISLAIKKDDHYKQIELSQQLQKTVFSTTVDNNIEIKETFILEQQDNYNSIDSYNKFSNNIIDGQLQNYVSSNIIDKTSSASCDRFNEGSLRYNPQKKAMLFCNGNNWMKLIAVVDDDDDAYYSSCNEILKSGYSTGDGIYTIDPDGSGSIDPFKVYCDMTTDDGGWMLYASINDPSIAITPSHYQNGYSNPDFSNIDKGNWIYDADFFTGRISVMRVNMGNVKDYFKPKPGYTFKQMLVSHENHLWSSNPTKNFAAPNYYNAHFGGSQHLWPKNEISGDNRNYLSFWGGNSSSLKGGCCQRSTSGSDKPAWGQTFKIWIR